MKFYIIKYTAELPDGFGGVTLGPLIRIRPRYKDDVGLLEHEKIHVRQWYALMGLGLSIAVALVFLVSPALWPTVGAAPFLHALIYKHLRSYRQWCEVQAYRKQIAVGDYANSDFAVTALVNKYGLGLDAHEARALFIN